MQLAVFCSQPSHEPTEPRLAASRHSPQGRSNRDRRGPGRAARQLDGEEHVMFQAFTYQGKFAFKRASGWIGPPK